MVAKIKPLLIFDVGCKNLLVAEGQVQLILAVEFSMVPAPWVHQTLRRQWEGGKGFWSLCIFPLNHHICCERNSFGNSGSVISLWDAAFALCNLAREPQQLMKWVAVVTVGMYLWREGTSNQAACPDEELPPVGWSLLWESGLCWELSYSRGKNSRDKTLRGVRAVIVMRSYGMCSDRGQKTVFGTGFRLISSRPWCQFILQRSFKQLLLIVIMQIELDTVQAQNVKMSPAQKNLIWMGLLKLFFFFIWK